MYSYKFDMYSTLSEVSFTEITSSCVLYPPIILSVSLYHLTSVKEKVYLWAKQKKLCDILPLNVPLPNQDLYLT